MLDHLTREESAEVLKELLARHRELRGEAREIAESLMSDVSVDAVAQEIVDLIGSVDEQELYGRSGKQPWGYVEPCEAAWELLDEAIEDTRASMVRRAQAGMHAASERICQGIVLGLHEVAGSDTRDPAVEWAPDFPAEAAAETLAALLKQLPRGQRQAARGRIVRAIEGKAKDWVEILLPAAGLSASRGRGRNR